MREWCACLLTTEKKKIFFDRKCNSPVVIDRQTLQHVTPCCLFPGWEKKHHKPKLVIFNLSVAHLYNELVKNRLSWYITQFTYHSPITARKCKNSITVKSLFCTWMLIFYNPGRTTGMKKREALNFWTANHGKRRNTSQWRLKRHESKLKTKTKKKTAKLKSRR